MYTTNVNLCKVHSLANDHTHKPHVKFLVFEAWFTNAQSRIIGCYECLSNVLCSLPILWLVPYFWGKFGSGIRLPSSTTKIVLRQGRMGKPRLLCTCILHVQAIECWRHDTRASRCWFILDLYFDILFNNTRQMGSRIKNLHFHLRKCVNLCWRCVEHVTLKNPKGNLLMNQQQISQITS